MSASSERSISPIPSQSSLRRTSRSPPPVAQRAEKRKSNLNELIQQEAERSGVGRLVGVVEAPAEKRGLSMSQEIQRLKSELRDLHIRFENKETECKQYRRAIESDGLFAEYEKVRAENLELMKANNVSFDGRDDTEYQSLKQEIRDLNDVVADQMSYIDEQNTALGEAAKDVEAGEKYIKSLEKKVAHLEKTKMAADQVFRENVKLREETKTLGRKIVAIHKAMASHAIQAQNESFMTAGSALRPSESYESELSEERGPSPNRRSMLIRRQSSVTEGSEVVAYIQNRYAVNGSFNKGASVPHTPKSSDNSPRASMGVPRDLVIDTQMSRPAVGTIGDADVNAQSYKVQLLKAERAIRALAERRALADAELEAMHALLRCVYASDNGQRTDRLSHRSNVSRGSLRANSPPPPREHAAASRAAESTPQPVKKRTSILKSASKFIKGKDKDKEKDKEKERDSTTDVYNLYEHSSTTVISEREEGVSHGSAMYNSDQYLELWVAANVAKIAHIDRAFPVEPREFALVEYSADSKLKEQLFGVVQESNVVGGGDPGVLFTYSTAQAAIAGLTSNATDTYEYLFESESAPAQWPSGKITPTAAQHRSVSPVPKRPTSPVPGTITVTPAAAGRYKTPSAAMSLSQLKASICHAEHLLLGWSLVRHKDKKTKHGTYFADLSSRCLVWSAEGAAEEDHAHWGFSTGDSYRERKRRVMFGEILDIVQGIVSERSSGLTSDVVRSASRVLTITHTSAQSESIVKTIYLEFYSEDEKDGFLDGMNCLLCKLI